MWIKLQQRINEIIVIYVHNKIFLADATLIGVNRCCCRNNYIIYHDWLSLQIQLDICVLYCW